MLDCVNASASVSTRRLGPYFNGALAIGLSGTTLLLAANAQLKPRLRSCKADHEVQLLRMPTTSDACLSGAAAAQQPARKRNRWRPLAAVPAALPLRQCEDVVNFRGNGPEDGRLLVSGPSSAVLLYTDYVNETSLTTGSRYARRIYVATVELTRDGQQSRRVRRRRIRGSSGSPPGSARRGSCGQRRATSRRSRASRRTGRRGCTAPRASCTCTSGSTTAAPRSSTASI